MTSRRECAPRRFDSLDQSVPRFTRGQEAEVKGLAIGNCWRVFLHVTHSPCWFQISSSRGHHHWWSVGVHKPNDPIYGLPSKHGEIQKGASQFAPWTEAHSTSPWTRAETNRVHELLFQSAQLPVATLSGLPQEHAQQGHRIWRASQHAHPWCTKTRSHVALFDMFRCSTFRFRAQHGKSKANDLRPPRQESTV